MGLSILISDPTDDQIAQIRAILDGDTPSKPAKAGKAAKAETTEEVIETTGDEAPEEAVTYTEKQLLKKERAELVSIAEGLGAGVTKGKRVPTLAAMILEAQSTATAADDEGEEVEAPSTEFEPDEWDEDVPPVKGKKDAKDSAKKDKKKGKKRKG